MVWASGNETGTIATVQRPEPKLGTASGGFPVTLLRGAPQQSASDRVQFHLYARLEEKKTVMCEGIDISELRLFWFKARGLQVDLNDDAANIENAVPL